MEAALLELDIEKDEERLRDLLDTFYWQELPGTPLGEAVAAVKPVGGKRKVRALGQFARDWQFDLARWAVVGDSITDNGMLTAVRIADGLAVVFNGNRYALECGNVGVASLSLADVLPLVKAWEEGGLDGARAVHLARGQAAGRRRASLSLAGGRRHRRGRRRARALPAPGAPGGGGPGVSMTSFDVIGLGALNVDRIYSVPRVVTDGAELIQESTAAAGGSAANTVYGSGQAGPALRFRRRGWR